MRPLKALNRRRFQSGRQRPSRLLQAGPRRRIRNRTPFSVSAGPDTVNFRALSGLSAFTSLTRPIRRPHNSTRGTNEAPHLMAPDPTPVSIDSLVDSASGDLVRVLRDLTSKLGDEHDRKLADAIDSARSSARRETDAAVQEALAKARDSQAEERRAFEARLRADSDAALMAATADAVSRLKAEHADAMAAARLEAESHARAESDQAVAVAVAAAEQRVQEDAAMNLARATGELEERLQADADKTLREAREDFERRLADAQVAAAAPVEAAIAAEQRVSERESHLQRLERLLCAVEKLDVASSLREALDALAVGVAHEAPRSVVMIVNGRVLRGWRANCPDAPAEFAKLEVPLEFAGPLADPVFTGATVPVQANALSDSTHDALAFLHLEEDHAGLAVPVIVDGRVVAIVYADDGAQSDREVPGGWPESIQVLARHAASVLAALTARRAAVRSVGVTPRTSHDEGGSAPLTKSA